MKELGFEIWRGAKGIIADVLWVIGKIIMYPAGIVGLTGACFCAVAEAIRGNITEHTDPVKLMDEIWDV